MTELSFHVFPTKGPSLPVKWPLQWPHHAALSETKHLGRSSCQSVLSPHRFLHTVFSEGGIHECFVLSRRSRHTFCSIKL
uniref:Uncharacterized protein n=1 Tax=Seriola dumerili TaxID=41447 RepID=A0A3B4T980_SERDU